jgi:hypothetical protein
VQRRAPRSVRGLGVGRLGGGLGQTGSPCGLRRMRRESTWMVRRGHAGEVLESEVLVV